MAKLSIQAFVSQYISHANLVAEKTGVPALVTLAQAALESGWGEHAPNYNFFGMTAGSNWNGKTNTYTNSACLLYTSPSPRDRQKSRMPSSA